MKERQQPGSVTKSDSALANPEAFSRMVNDTYNRVYLSALAITRNPDMAEDVAQETFLRAWLKRDSVAQPASQLQPWLIRIATNMALQWLRTGQTRSRLLPLIPLEDITVEPADKNQPDPRRSAGQAEQNAQLTDALKSMPDDLRQVVLLHYAEGMSASDIARMNGEAPSTVTRRLDRARAQLRQQLESGLAAGLAMMKPGPRSLEKTMAALAAALALPAATRAQLLQLAADTPPPPMIDPVTSTATAATIKEAGIMTNFIAKTGAAKLLTGIAAAAIIGGGAYTAITYIENFSPGQAAPGSNAGGAAQITAMSSDTRAQAQIDSTKRKLNSAGLRSRSGAASGGSSGKAATTTGAVALADNLTTAADTPIGYVTITGGVYDEATSEPLANAIVRVTAPAKDMRFVRKHEDAAKLLSVTADSVGAYKLKVPLYDEISSMSLDAMSPGNGSLAGTYMSGGDFTKHGIPVSPGDVLTLNLNLPKAAYVAGQVVDEKGNPISGAVAHGKIEADGSYSVGITDTDENGYFEMFDYPENLDYFTTGGRGTIEFASSDYMTTSVANVYQLSAVDRSSLRVVMSDGYEIVGQLLLASGVPAAKTPLRIEYANYREQRNAVTDAAGNFLLKGLPPGSAVIYAVTSDLSQRIHQDVVVPVSGDLTLRMEPSPDADVSKAVTLFGMKLIDVTPELAQKYLLDSTTGVLVLDAGPEIKRLGIADDSILDEGALFWMAGNKKVSNLKEFVSEIQRVNSLPKPDGFVDEGYNGYVRVVYNINRFRISGSNTQYMQLTPEDTAELQQFYKEHYGPKPD